MPIEQEMMLRELLLVLALERGDLSEASKITKKLEKVYKAVVKKYGSRRGRYFKSQTTQKWAVTQ